MASGMSDRLRLGLRSKRPRGVAATAVCAISLFAAQIDASARSVSDLVDAALSESSAIAESAAALDEAADNLVGGMDFESTRLVVSSTATYRPDDPDFNPSASATLTLPLFPQISFTGRVSTDFATVGSTFGVSVSPLAPGRVTYQTWKAYEQAQVQLISATTAVPRQIETALFASVAAEQSLEIANEELAYHERAFDASNDRYEAGEQTWSQFDQAAESLNGAERSLIEAERSVLSARKQLIDTIGPEFGTEEIKWPELESLETKIATLRSQLEDATSSPTSLSQLNLQVELRSLTRQLAATSLFNPTISISSDSNLPFTQISGTLSLSLSPGDYQKEERDTIQELITEAEDDIALESTILKIELEMLERLIASSEKLYESASRSLETAETNFDEISFDFDAGDRTALELEEARLSLSSAAHNRYQHAVGLLSLYGEHLEYLEIGRLASELEW